MKPWECRAVRIASGSVWSLGTRPRQGFVFRDGSGFGEEVSGAGFGKGADLAFFAGVVRPERSSGSVSSCMSSVTCCTTVSSMSLSDGDLPSKNLSTRLSSCVLIEPTVLSFWFLPYTASSKGRFLLSPSAQVAASGPR